MRQLVQAGESVGGEHMIIKEGNMAGRKAVEAIEVFRKNFTCDLDFRYLCQRCGALHHWCEPNSFFLETLHLLSPCGWITIKFKKAQKVA